MVNISKSGNSIKFVFTDSDHYLYGNGEIEVPVNSLLLAIDESEMVTFKKLSGDPFLSFRADNSNLGTKAAIEQFYKDNMVGSTGGDDVTIDPTLDTGSTNPVANSAITQALENKLDASAYTPTDLSEYWTSAQTQSAIDGVNNALTAHTANTTVHVTSAEKTAWNAKQDALYIYTEDNNLGTAELHSNDSSIIFNAGGASITANNTMGVNTFNVASTGVTINGDAVATEPYVDAAITGKVDTSAITTSITSGSTDSEIPTAKAVYDAIPTGGTSVTVDPTLDTGSTNPVANSAITNAINTVSGAIPSTYISSATVDSDQGYLRFFRFSTPSNYNYLLLNNATINNRGILSNGWGGFNTNFSLVETSAITSAITSGSTDAQVPSAKATYDAITAATTGGGATYSAGTNISIDTANTINCTLPITAGTGNYSILNNRNNYQQSTVTSADSIAWGTSNHVKSDRSFALGATITINTGATGSIGVGFQHNLNNSYTSAFGEGLKTYNRGELASGRYNNSVTGSTASGNTIFSVGDGASGSARHNAFEIRQNGDIYIALNGQDVKLQDQLGGGGGMDDDTQQLISTAFNDLNDRKADLTELTKYQKKGDYVVTSTLADYMTNASFDEYATAKERIISGALNDLNDKFGGLKLVKISQTDYDNLATKDENTLYIINNVI